MDLFKDKRFLVECGERGEFITPETPEEPLIRIERQGETGLFQGSFALELEGVTRKAILMDGDKTVNEKDITDTARYRDSLITCLSGKQSLDFVYQGRRDPCGNPLFYWRIIGKADGDSFCEVVADTKQLWQNVKVCLNVMRNDYSFIPVVREEGLRDNRIKEGWVGLVRPIGIDVFTQMSSAIGFLQESESGISRGRVIIPPLDDQNGGQNFDVPLAVSADCLSEVVLTVSIRPVTLSDQDLNKISAAFKWVTSGEGKKIKSYAIDQEGIEDENLLKKLQNNLIAWMRIPDGFRITCEVLSPSPIPASFLTLVGREFFSCPFSITMGRIGDTLSEVTTSEEVLDLRDVINRSYPLPPLFSDRAKLLKAGVKRIFPHTQLMTMSQGIILGDVFITGVRKEVRLGPGDRSRHVYICGGTGTGKSTLLCNMLKQDIENGEGVILIDPHGDLYRQTLELIPTRRIHDVVLIDPCDFDHAVGINFLECLGPYKAIQINFVVNEMIKIFDRLYDLKQTGGPIFEQYMRNALMLALDNDFSGATLMDIPVIFEDKDYRKFLIERCPNDLIKTFWTKQAEKAGGEATLENLAPYITSKLNQFTHNAMLRPIIGQSKSTIDFRLAMDAGKILLVNLSKGLLGELDAMLLGMILVGKIFNSAMGRVTQMPEKRRPVFLYIDEFQNFVTDSVAHLLSEARKFGIFLTLANQNLAQLTTANTKQSILDSVMGNVGSLMMFRLGAVDSEKLAVYTKPEFTAQDLQELPDFTAVARLIINNSPVKPFAFKTRPLVQSNERASIEEIINHSRKRYTVQTIKVEKGIIQRRTSYMMLGRNESLSKEKEDDLMLELDEMDFGSEPTTFRRRRQIKRT